MNAATYAVIFTTKASTDQEGYAEMASRMKELVQLQPGFVGMESAREDLGITVSYWSNLPSISKWKEHPEHQKAQYVGKKQWYDYYHLSICKIERSYVFSRK